MNIIKSNWTLLNQKKKKKKEICDASILGILVHD